MNSKWIKQNHGRNNASLIYKWKHNSIKLLCTYTAFSTHRWIVGMPSRLTNCTFLPPRLTSHSPTHLSALLFMNYNFSHKNANVRIKWQKHDFLKSINLKVPYLAARLSRFSLNSDIAQIKVDIMVGILYFLSISHSLQTIDVLWRIYI